MTMVDNPHGITATRRELEHAAATLGDHLRGRLDRLCRAAGTADPEGRYRDSLTELLGAGADRPLSAPAPPSGVSDDHTPAEFSVTFPAGDRPRVRVLTEPGCGAATLAENGRLGRLALQRTARRWDFPLDPLRRVETLFLPAAPQGTFALWCAMELPATPGTPGFKAYLDPAAHGPEHTADVVEEALARFGCARAWPLLREHVAARYPHDDRFAFFAVDLGPWAAPRVKVYVAHHRFDLDGVRRVAGLFSERCGRQAVEFCRIAAGTDRFDRRPPVSCLSFTGRNPRTPAAYTLHLPVRDHVTDDGHARDRAASLLRRQGLPTGLLDRALGAVSRRRPADGVGLISYLSLVQAPARPPRVTVYLAPEAYRVAPARVRESRPGAILSRESSPRMRHAHPPAS
ncbi:tryptophan dimethylallyltransferase family protein [Embleya sp. NPDC050493]|uniref:tryptophan dimethylallyltransferase family protein n=1 Tax=Embleya sp. NPDC050493 TaxID=3363989 RepID=UPI0037A0C01A